MTTPSQGKQDLMIVHFTTVHDRSDTRVRYKLSDSLARQYPHKVALYVMDGQGNEQNLETSLKIIDLGIAPASRIARIVLGNWRAYRALRAASPEIAHFHDPELILLGLLLKLSGIKVIYDIHEDVSKQILSKNYLKPAILRHSISYLFGVFERFAVSRLDASVAAANSIALKFSKGEVHVIRNFPKADIMPLSGQTQVPNHRFVISYAGTLSRARGIQDLVAAMDLLPEMFELHLLGDWHPKKLETQCQEMPGWSKCQYLGKVPHDEAILKMKNAHLGVQLTHDIPNHTGGLATKVFEYLFLGIPVLMSDTIEKRQIYGDLVFYAQPSHAEKIARKVQKIADNYDQAIQMTNTNLDHVRSCYSWEAEEKRLFDIYKNLLSCAASS